MPEIKQLETSYSFLFDIFTASKYFFQKCVLIYYSSLEICWYREKFVESCNKNEKGLG
jgi:hypothetical protein